MDINPSLTTDEWEIRLGQEVRRLRRSRELTQAELAGRANVSLSSVKSLEGGRGSTVATLVRVVRALERADWLLALAPPIAVASPMATLRERRRGDTAARRVRHPVAK